MTKSTIKASRAEAPEAPRLIVAGALSADVAAQLRVVDAKTGEPIERVLDADADAGTVRRYAVEDGNLVRDGDSFAIVEEERAIRIEWIEPADKGAQG